MNQIVKDDDVYQTRKEVFYPEIFIKYCESIGLHPDDFANLEENIDRIVYGAQKAVSLLFFKNAAIVSHKMDLHLQDEINYPSKQISGMKLVYEMMLGMTAIDKKIDENMAIKTLENMGYTINK